MQVEACSGMPNHLNRYIKAIYTFSEQHWQRSTKRAAAILTLILILGTGLILICCSERMEQKNRLSSILHPPAWAEKYFLDTILDAESAVLLDSDRNRIIYEKRMHERMYPASTTKILTALIAIENSKPNEIVIVGPEIRLAPGDGSKAGLCEGEKICMRDLLYGLMLPSGNDAAYVIAAYIGGKRLGRNRANTGKSISYFVEMMNQRAIKSGARMSHFANPDGYQNLYHFSTAYDLALFAKEATKQALFREIVKCPSHRRFRQGKNNLPDQPCYLWENRNLLLDSSSEFYIPEANGIKTGHTDEAGFCLVASASHHKKNLITVILKSTSAGVWNDTAILLSHGFTVR
jgi:serine-type D-Ala-D-Ala carboxypeptidase (penicillin-binding protein 5/6)